MADYFSGEYEINDGYAGGSRTQHFRFNAGDLEDEMSDEEIRKLYEDAAYEHFRQHIDVTVNDCDEFVEWAREYLKKQKGGA